MLNIIYEDNQIIVVEKPYNVPTQEDSSGDVDLLTMVKNYIKEKYLKPGNVYIGLVHRLDRPVGGLMVFARTSKSASRLSLQIQNHDFNKSYLAVVHGSFKETTGTYNDKLKKLDNGNTVIANDGKDSLLNYEVLKTDNNISLVKIDLKTGRHHQIRAEFAYHNHPLCGDQRYGLQDKTQIALYAYEISFLHPITNERLTFTKYPTYGYFKNFNLK